MNVFYTILAGLGLALLAVGIGFPRVLRAWIRKRLQGYSRHQNRTDPALPRHRSEKAASEKPGRVAVLGAGVAGLTSAVTLARRGLEVTVFESKDYLGGKLGSWPVELEPGREVWVSHGFHAFFGHYYNLNRFLDSLGIRHGFQSIGDYVIVGADGEQLRFADTDPTPGFNLWSLMRGGAFSFGDAVRAPGRDLYGIFLEYEQESTFSRLDGLSFADFSRVAQVPPRLKVAFNTFARAFFADESKLSLAELTKSFHFYYLSHDAGLVYDYPVRDYDAAILGPIRDELARCGAEVRLGTRVTSLERNDRELLVNHEPFDRVVLATDVVGARAIMTQATGIPQIVAERFERLKPGQRYAVLRIWIDKDIREDIPVFVITDGKSVLDSVTVYHRFEVDTFTDLADHPGYVLELHSYAVPDELEDDEVRDALLRELVEFFPELKGMTVAHQHWQLRQDFTAFHVGMHEHRPEVQSGVSGLYCAGDWVKLPFPAMLLEAACASGLCAANEILTEYGLQQEAVLSVPLKGLMAGIKEPPARKKLLAAAARASSTRS